jgi:hypothetical protein
VTRLIKDFEAKDGWKAGTRERAWLLHSLGIVVSSLDMERLDSLPAAQAAIRNKLRQAVAPHAGRQCAAGTESARDHRLDRAGWRKV